MNKERIAIGYRSLEKAHGKFNLSGWSTFSISNRFLFFDQGLETVESMHTCGGVACAGGYLSLSPEFKALGGECNSGLGPIFNGEELEAAIQEFYECSDSDQATVIDLIHYCEEYHPTLIFYGFDDDDIRESLDHADIPNLIGSITATMVQEKFAILYFILCICE